jgi:hypothetical protein
MDTIIKGYIVDNNGQPISRVKINLTSNPTDGNTPPPTYKVSDGSLITFEKRGSTIIAILTMPNGLVTRGPALLSASYETAAEEILLANNIVDPSSGAPLPYIIISSTDNYKTIDDTKNSNDKGEWEFTYPSTDINTSLIRITFSKSKYDLKTITNPIVTQSTPELITIDIARISLQPVAEVTGKETTKIIKQTNESESKEIKSKSRPSAEGAITEVINNKKEELKRTLIPFILKLLLPFGTLALQAVLARLPKTEIAKLANCPTQSELQKIINKRSKLVKQINNLFDFITKITRTLQIINIAITAIKVGLLAIAAIPPPGFPGAAAILNSKLGKLLDVAGVGVNLLTIALATFGAFLGVILYLLNSLDFLLQKCSEDNAKAQAETEVQAAGIKPTDPGYDTAVQTQLKSIQNIYLEQINDEINALASSTLEDLQQSQPNETNTYKGFRLELKVNEKNQSSFIQRYAQALDKNGVAVLKTEPSFASDPNVLLSQLKFIIDSNPNITAE